jgi:four helix bundle protein
MAHHPSENIQQRSFRFSCAIVRFYVEEAQRTDAGRTLGRQLLRCGTSIGANLEEAEAGQSRADFISKCGIALKEARETHYWLRLMSATGLVDTKKTDPLIVESNELIAILTTIIKKSRGV